MISAYQHSFFDNQHCFFKEKSALTQLITSYLDGFEAFNSGFRTDVVFINFANAFYSAAHLKLWLKLRACGIGAAFSAHREIFVRTKFQSEIGNIVLLRPVLSGMPQCTLRHLFYFSFSR